jgi:hypothetical protein
MQSEVVAQQIKERHVGIIEGRRDPRSVHVHYLRNRHGLPSESTRFRARIFSAILVALCGLCDAPASAAEIRRAKHTPTVERSEPIQLG